MAKETQFDIWRKAMIAWAKEIVKWQKENPGVDWQTATVADLGPGSNPPLPPPPPPPQD